MHEEANVVACPEQVAREARPQVARGPRNEDLPDGCGLPAIIRRP